MRPSLIQGLLVQTCDPLPLTPAPTNADTPAGDLGPAAHPSSTPQGLSLFPWLSLPCMGRLTRTEAIACIESQNRAWCPGPAAGLTGFSAGTSLRPAPAPPLLPSLPRFSGLREEGRLCRGLETPRVLRRGGERGQGTPRTPQNLRRKRRVLKGPLQDLRANRNPKARSQSRFVFFGCHRDHRAQSCSNADVDS